MTPNPVIAEPIAVEVILADWPIRLLVNRKYLPFLKENGLLQGDALLNLSNHTLVKKHYHRGVCDRIVDRVLLGNHKIKAYRKICRSPGLSRSIEYLLEGAGNIPRRNWTANLNLAAAGIPVAAPIALIEKRIGGFANESALLSAELSGYVPLSRLLHEAYLENRPQAFSQLKRKVADALTRLLGQLIEAQVVNPTLSSKHIFLTQNKSALDYVLIDVGRCRLPNRLKPRHLVEPLSVLHRSIALNLFSSAERLRLFKRIFDGKIRHRKHKRFIKRIVRKAGERGFKDIKTVDY